MASAANPYTVLITDGEQRSALAIVRSLGTAGYRIHVASSTGQSMSGASRHAIQDHRAADALDEPQQFANDIHNIAHSIGANVIIPVTEASLLAILPHAESWKKTLGVSIPFASLEQFQQVSDKEQLLNTAQQLGIAIPQQHVARNSDEALALADTVQYPLVAKPARSVAEGNDERVKLTVQHAASPDALKTILSELPPQAYPLLLQQRIIGPGVGAFLLTWNGEILCEFSHQRLRERPPSGGVAVYAESIPLAESLKQRSRTLLDAFNWQGVAMIEYKLDASTGTPYLMEINGRFWGSLQLAIDSGADFPAQLVAAAMGERPAPIIRYRTGNRMRWFWGDVDHLLARLRKSPAVLALPPGAPPRWRAVASFFRCRTLDRDSTFRWRDPKPFMRETASWFRALRPGPLPPVPSHPTS